MSGSRTTTQAYLNEDYGGHLVSISIAFAVLTTVFLALRYHARRFTGSAAFGLDDLFLLTAYVINLGMCALGIVMVKVADVGRHIEFVEATEPAKMAKWAQCILAFEIIYFSSVAFPKLAVLSLYLRVFAWRGAMRQATLALMAVVASTGIALVVAACLQCRPAAFFWDRTIPGGSCVDIQAFFHASSIPQFVLDFFIMGLPLKTIWDLKLPTHKRIALLLIFLVASFGVVSSIIRAITFFGTSAFTDETYASVDLVGWSTIETGTYIIAACLPHLRPLFAHYTPQWLRNVVHHTLVTASTSLSRSRGGGKMTTTTVGGGGKSKSRFADDDDDEVELTGKSMLTASSTSGARTTVVSTPWEGQLQMQQQEQEQQEQEQQEHQQHQQHHQQHQRGFKSPHALSHTRSLDDDSLVDDDEAGSGDDFEEAEGERSRGNTVSSSSRAGQPSGHGHGHAHSRGGGSRDAGDGHFITVTNEVTVRTERKDGTPDVRGEGGEAGGLGREVGRGSYDDDNVI